MIIWYVLGFFLCLIAICEFYAFKTGVPTVTSTPSIRKKMIELLKEEAANHKGDKPFTILDLGSGTGKLTLEIAKAIPDARIIGIEISIIPYLLSHLRKLMWFDKKVEYKRQDFWAYDVSQIDAITIYMTAKIRDRMAQKLKEELAPGTLIILNETHLPEWTPIDTYKVGLLNLKVVVYRQD